LYMRR